MKMKNIFELAELELQREGQEVTEISILNYAIQIRKYLDNPKFKIPKIKKEVYKIHRDITKFYTIYDYGFKCNKNNQPHTNKSYLVDESD